jgi:hypothetical protein
VSLRHWCVPASSPGHSRGAVTSRNANLLLEDLNLHILALSSSNRAAAQRIPCHPPPRYSRRREGTGREADALVGLIRCAPALSVLARRAKRRSVA